MNKIMDRLEITTGEYPLDNEPFTAVTALDERVLFDLLREKRNFEITMPCGASVKFEQEADIPTDDLPCPCGDPTHWIIKYDVTDISC